MITTAQDALDYMMYRCGERLTGSRFATQALLYLNLAYLELYSGTCRLAPNFVVNFPWAIAYPEHSYTIGQSDSGDSGASFVKGGTNITVPSLSGTYTLGGYIRLGSDKAIYRITSQGPTSVTVLAPISSDTNADSAYRIMQLELEIEADVLRLISPLRIYVNNDSGDERGLVHATDYDSFMNEHRYPEDKIPDRFAVVRHSSGGMQIRFNHCPSDTYRCDLSIITKPSVLSTGTTINMPAHHRQALADLASYYLLMDMRDTRAQTQYQMAASGYAAMLKEVGITDVKLQPVRPNEEVRFGV